MLDKVFKRSHAEESCECNCLVAGVAVAGPFALGCHWPVRPFLTFRRLSQSVGRPFGLLLKTHDPIRIGDK